MRYLEGKFFLRGDEEFYRTGQVIKCTKETALVRYDQMENSGPSSTPMEIVCIHDEFAPRNKVRQGLGVLRYARAA
jgi:hypothetical protein